MSSLAALAPKIAFGLVNSNRTSRRNPMVKRQGEEKVAKREWAVRCKSCERFSRYSDYRQKPRSFDSRVTIQSDIAQCPRCRTEHQYGADDLQLIASELLN